MFFQTPEEFFADNIECIKETAKIIATKDNPAEKQFLKMKENYFKKIGTRDEECLFTGTEKERADKIIAEIRHLPFEVFWIFCKVKGEWIEVFQKRGSISEVENISIDEINKAILSFRVMQSLRNMLLYIVHNHPYIYNASPSEADLITAEALYKNINDINSEAKRLGICLQVQIVDYCIVTDFDYWSIKQQCDKL